MCIARSTYENRAYALCPYSFMYFAWSTISGVSSLPILQHDYLEVDEICWAYPLCPYSSM